MHIVQQWLPDRGFSVPNAQVIRGREITVPPVGGMNPEAARRKLERLGMNALVENDYQVDSEYSVGTVAYTSPGSYSIASSGDTVTIYVSDGTPYVPPAPETEPEFDEPDPAPQPPPPPDGGGGDNGGGFGGGNGNGGGFGGGNGNGGGNGGGPGGGRDD
jgi:hypothetical protein